MCSPVEVYEQAQAKDPLLPNLTIFSQSRYGVSVALMGIVYMALFGHLMLPGSSLRLGASTLLHAMSADSPWGSSILAHVLITGSKLFPEGHVSMRVLQYVTTMMFSRCITSRRRVWFVTSIGTEYAWYSENLSPLQCVSTPGSPNPVRRFLRDIQLLF